MKYRIVELNNGRYSIEYAKHTFKLFNFMRDCVIWEHVISDNTLQEANELIDYMIAEKQREIDEREGRKIKQVIREEEV